LPNEVRSSNLAPKLVLAVEKHRIWRAAVAVLGTPGAGRLLHRSLDRNTFAVGESATSPSPSKGNAQEAAHSQVQNLTMQSLEGRIVDSAWIDGMTVSPGGRL